MQPLDADTVDRILCSLSDFSSLRSALLTCRSSYGAFQSRPRSIIQSIAHNLLGPDYPHALRVLPADDIDGDDHACLTREGVSLLVENAKTVEALRDLFSWRNKDRKCKTSQLTPTETIRFNRALYRIWYFCNTFGNSGAHILRHYEEDEEVQSLSAFDDTELCELVEVRNFLEDVVMWVSCAGGDLTCLPTPAFCSWHVSFGPRHVLECYQGLSVVLTSHGPLNLSVANPTDEFIFRTVETVWKERGFDKGDQNFFIVDDVVDELDQCERCACSYGVKLWGQSNWVLLKGQFGLNVWSITNVLDGNLWHNEVEKRPLRECLAQISYDTFMHEMFDPRINSSDDWNKDMWLCLECVKMFVRLNLRTWWIAKKRSTGQNFQGDCRNGYDCRHQVTNINHALRLNHLCDPILDDIPQSRLS